MICSCLFLYSNRSRLLRFCFGKDSTPVVALAAVAATAASPIAAPLIAAAAPLIAAAAPMVAAAASVAAPVTAAVVASTSAAEVFTPDLTSTRCRNRFLDQERYEYEEDLRYMENQKMWREIENLKKKNMALTQTKGRGRSKSPGRK